MSKFKELNDMVDTKAMVATLVYGVGSVIEAEAGDLDPIIDEIIEEQDLDTFLVTCFKSHMKRKDRIQKYIELQGLAEKASEDFSDYLAEIIMKKLNRLAPEGGEPFFAQAGPAN